MRITKRQLRRLIQEAFQPSTPEAWAEQNGLQVEIHHSSGEKVIYLTSEQLDALESPMGKNWDLQQDRDRETWIVFTGEYP